MTQESGSGDCSFKPLQKPLNIFNKLGTELLFSLYNVGSVSVSKVSYSKCEFFSWVTFSAVEKFKPPLIITLFTSKEHNFLTIVLHICIWLLLNRYFCIVFASNHDSINFYIKLTQEQIHDSWCLKYATHNLCVSIL